MPDLNSPSLNDGFAHMDQVTGRALRAIALGPTDADAADPQVQRWINILSPPKVELGLGLLGDPSTWSVPVSDTTGAAYLPDGPDANVPDRATPNGPISAANREIAYAGTLIDDRSDGVVRHCTYERPGLPTFTIKIPAHQPCDPTTPAPRA